VRQRILPLVVGFLLVWGGGAAALAPAPAGAAPASGPQVKLFVGKSQVITFENRLKRISVGEPKVVEVVVVSPRELLLNAKAAGGTTMIVWDERGGVFTYDVSVQSDPTLAQQVRERLAQLLPKEELTVEQVGTGVVLSGVATTEEARNTAVSVAETVAPKKVVDNIQVDEVPQVLIKVHFLEVSRSGAIQVGVGFVRRAQGRHDIGVFPGAPGFAPGGLFLEGSAADVSPNVAFSSIINLFFGNRSPRTVGFFMRALQEKGHIRTLAEPNLRVMSGKEATFLVGGQVPVPVPGQDGQVTITYRDFGIRLKFKPKVRKSGMIEFSVEPEVSAIDNTLAVVVQGFNVPGFKTSNTKTEVVVRDGQTMPISGLLSEARRRNIAQLPFIGDVPILGQLFQSKDFQEDKTELVILVTPQIIRTRRVAEALVPRSGFEVGRTPGSGASTAGGGGGR